MFFLIAAAQLSVTDLQDLHCVYVFQTAAMTLKGEERLQLYAAEQWFEGRLSARQPKLTRIIHEASDLVLADVA